MSERTLKILLIDESAARLRLLEDALMECGYSNVACAGASGDVLEKVYQTNPDVILIDVESPTRDTLEQLTLIQQVQPRPVVLFTQDQNVHSIRAAISSGVSAYVTTGISATEVRPAIDIAMATFKSFQQLRDELASAQASLSEMKIIHRAKSILMDKRKVTEDQAYHFMRRLAMNRKRKLVEVAKDLIALNEFGA